MGNETARTSFEEVLERDGKLIFTNKGVSMMPLLRHDRDLMIIEKKGPERCQKLDAVLFKRLNGQYVLHRILKVYDGGYWIVGDNCTSGENVAEEQILGILTAVVRDGKTIKVTDKRYLSYVHLWCDHYKFRFFILKCTNLAKRILRVPYRGLRKLFSHASGKKEGA